MHLSRASISLPAAGTCLDTVPDQPHPVLAFADEDSSEAQPAKRLTRSIPVKQPGPEAEEAPRVASQAREQRQREATPVQQNEEEEQLTCVICNVSGSCRQCSALVAEGTFQAVGSDDLG